MVKGKLERDVNLFIAHNLIDLIVAFQSERELQVDSRIVKIKMRVRFHLGKNKPFAGLISMINQSNMPLGYHSITVPHLEEIPTMNNPYVAKCETKITPKVVDPNDPWTPSKMERQEIRDGVIAMIDELDGLLFKRKLKYIKDCKKYNRNFALWSMLLFTSHACISTIFCPYMPSNWHVFAFNVLIYTAIIYVESMLLHKCFDTPVYLARKELMNDVWNTGKDVEFETD